MLKKLVDTTAHVDDGWATTAAVIGQHKPLRRQPYSKRSSSCTKQFAVLLVAECIILLSCAGRCAHWCIPEAVCCNAFMVVWLTQCLEVICFDLDMVLENGHLQSQHIFASRDRRYTGVRVYPNDSVRDKYPMKSRNLSLASIYDITSIEDLRSPPVGPHCFGLSRSFFTVTGVVITGLLDTSRVSRRGHHFGKNCSIPGKSLTGKSLFWITVPQTSWTERAQFRAAIAHRCIHIARHDMPGIIMMMRSKNQHTALPTVKGTLQHQHPKAFCVVSAVLAG